jgi:hypothetical protein
VFLIGEESLLPAEDGEVDRGSDPTTATRGLGGTSARRPSSHRLPAALQGARGPALLGLAAGAVALAALRPWGGGGPERPAHAASPRSPLISRSAAGVPAGSTSRAHHPESRPVEVPRRSVVHHRRSRPAKATASPRPKVIQAEPEREPTPQVAPVSSPAMTRTEATPEPERQPAATAGPTPPSPPPPSSGGGPGGVEDPPASRGSGHAGVETFGFER